MTFPSGVGVKGRVGGVVGGGGGGGGRTVLGSEALVHEAVRVAILLVVGPGEGLLEPGEVAPDIFQAF